MRAHLAATIAAAARQVRVGGGRVVLQASSARESRAQLQQRAAGLAGRASPQLVVSSISWDTQVGSLCGGRLPAWLPRARQTLPQQQLRGMADGDKGRWNEESRSEEPAEIRTDGAGGVSQSVDPLHPLGLNISVFSGNVDLAMRKLRRKVIVEGVMKKFKKNRYHVTPTEQNKLNGDVGLRRMERRRMRSKLKHVWIKMNSLKMDN